MNTPIGVLFPAGALVATPAALDALAKAGIDPSTLLMKHFVGNWGDVDRHDRRANEAALVDGGRLLSVYKVLPGGAAVWVITEADRSATTVLLPDDY
jgi:hypothetical protein